MAAGRRFISDHCDDALKRHHELQNLAGDLIGEYVFVHPTRKARSEPQPLQNTPIRSKLAVDITADQNTYYNVPKTKTGLETELEGLMVVESEPTEFLKRVLPEGELPANIRELFYSLNDDPVTKVKSQNNRLKKASQALYVRGAWKDFPVMLRTGSNEKKLAAFLNKVCRASEPHFTSVPKEKRTWLGNFSTEIVLGVHRAAKRKPDLVLVQKNAALVKKIHDGSVDYSVFDASGELKAQIANVKKITEHRYNETAGQQLHQGAYFTFGAQEDRRFCPTVGFINHIARFSIYDRGALITTCPIDIHKSPLTFLHLLIGLCYAPRHRLGYDTTITTKGDKRFITVQGKTYRIVKCLWKTVMINGRATCVWELEDSEGNIYVLKDSWVITSRLPSEVHYLQYAKEAGVTGIPDLVDFEDVVIAGELDTCDNNRGSHKGMLDRVHRRLLFRGKAVPIFFFKSKRELIAALIDILECHEQLCFKALVLHRDISLYNLMLIDDGSGRRRGILIDFDYAKDLNKEREQEVLKTWSSDGPVLPENPNSKGKEKPPSLKPAALNSQESRIREHNKVVFEDEQNRRGIRTGTQPFIASEILANPNTEHTYKHDLESIYFVILYLCAMFQGPENQPIPKELIPVFIAYWCDPEKYEPPLLAFFKQSFLGRSDYINIVDSFTDYMRDLGTCLGKLHATLSEVNKPRVNHKEWISILKECLASLPSDDVSTPARPDASPVIRGNIPADIGSPIDERKRLAEIIAKGEQLEQLEQLVANDTSPTRNDGGLATKMQQMRLVAESPLGPKSTGKFKDLMQNNSSGTSSGMNIKGTSSTGNTSATAFESKNVTFESTTAVTTRSSISHEVDLTTNFKVAPNIRVLRSNTLDKRPVWQIPLATTRRPSSTSPTRSSGAFHKTTAVSASPRPPSSRPAGNSQNLTVAHVVPSISDSLMRDPGSVTAISESLHSSSFSKKKLQGSTQISRPQSSLGLKSLTTPRPQSSLGLKSPTTPRPHSSLADNSNSTATQRLSPLSSFDRNNLQSSTITPRPPRTQRTTGTTSTLSRTALERAATKNR